MGEMVSQLLKQCLQRLAVLVQPASVDLKMDAGPALIEERPPQLGVSLETFHSEGVKRRYSSAPPLDGEVELQKGHVPLALGRRPHASSRSLTPWAICCDSCFVPPQRHPSVAVLGCTPRSIRRISHTRKRCEPGAPRSSPTLPDPYSFGLSRSRNGG